MLRRQSSRSTRPMPQPTDASLLHSLATLSLGKQAGSRGSYLLCMPDDVITEVLCQSSPRELASWFLVNKRIYYLIMNTAQLHYLLLLVVSHYREGLLIGDYDLPKTIYCRDLLQEHVDNWRHHNFTESSFNVRFGRPYDPDNFPPTSRHLANGVLASAYKNVVTIYELPSRLRNTPSRSWRFELSFSPHHVVVVPDQDLLILVQRTVEERDAYGNVISTLDFVLKRLSTGEKHPLTGKNMISLTANFGGRLEIRCFSSYLAVSYITYDNGRHERETHHVDIFDWKKSALITESFPSDGLRCAPVIFLDLKLVLLLRSQPEDRTVAEIVVCAFGSEECDPKGVLGGRFQPFAAFTLPTGASPRSELCKLTVNASAPTDPAPYGRFAYPLTVEDDRRILHIQQENFHSRGREICCLDVVVPVHHLLPYCYSLGYELRGNLNPRHVRSTPFAEWSQGDVWYASRVLDPTLVDAAVNGTRLVHRLDPGSLELVDYRTQYPLLIHRNRPTGVRRLMSDTCAARKRFLKMFTLDIKGCNLPFREEAVKRMVGEVMMDEEHIVILKSASGNLPRDGEQVEVIVLSA